MTDKFKESDRLAKLLDIKKKDLTDTRKRFQQSIVKINQELSVLETLSKILEWVPESVVKKAMEELKEEERCSP